MAGGVVQSGWTMCSVREKRRGCGSVPTRGGGCKTVTTLRMQASAVQVSLSVCLPVHLSVRLSICLFVRPSICPSVRLSICLSVFPSVCPSVRPSIRLSVCLSVCLSLGYQSYPVLAVSAVPTDSNGSPQCWIKTRLFAGRGKAMIIPVAIFVELP